MSFVFGNDDLVRVALGVVLFQIRQPLSPFAGFLISFVGCVLAAHVKREREIAQAERRRFVGVAGHHGSSGETIGHARRELIDAVAAGGVAHQVDAVGIHVFEYDQVLNQPIEHRIDVFLVPEIPGVSGGARREVDAFLQFVETLLVLPLLIVDLFGRATAAVHGDEEAATSLGLFAEDLVGELHLQLAVLDDLRLHLFGARFPNSFDVFFPEHVLCDE